MKCRHLKPAFRKMTIKGKGGFDSHNLHDLKAEAVSETDATDVFHLEAMHGATVPVIISPDHL
jgi:hypothetical protein